MSLLNAIINANLCDNLCGQEIVCLLLPSNLNKQLCLPYTRPSYWLQLECDTPNSQGDLSINTDRHKVHI